MDPKRVQQIDKTIGRNIRIYRLAKNLSQTELGDQIGVSFQQIQKYENGVNRVGSGRLFQIAAILDVHVSALFEGHEESAHSEQPAVLNLLTEPQSLRLAQAFSKISDATIRRSLVQLAEKLAEPG